MKVQKEPVRIIYQDSALVVVEKATGFLAVPGRGPDKQDCVEKRIREFFPQIPRQPAVHRLDMDTSGLMILALTREAHRILSQRFADREVEKRYIAMVEGVVQGEAGEIEFAFRLDPDNRPCQVYDSLNGKIGISRWRKIEVAHGRTRIEFTPLTGRTHQLRLHAAHPLGLGCPIVGDRLYGTRIEGQQRMLLHASFLRFAHPVTGKWLECESPPMF